MNKTLKNSIKISDLQAQYDTCAKLLLSNKIILAHILKEIIEEFKELDIYDIVELIEGEPYISEVPIEPGLTNRVMTESGDKIIGNNTENFELKEGTIYFDIIFYVRMKDGLSQMIINIEAQRSPSPGYPVVNRAIYYSSRMISSQKERNFRKSDYGNILRTYSIWICFNMDENCLNYLHISDTPVVGNHKWSGDMDLINIVLIGIDKNLTAAALKGTESRLHYLLGTLFSDKINTTEKINLLTSKFNMEESIPIRRELDDMEYLSDIILADGIEKGIEKGIKKGILQGIQENRNNVIQEMLRDNQPYTLIRKYTGASDEDIRQIEEKLIMQSR